MVANFKVEGDHVVCNSRIIPRSDVRPIGQFAKPPVAPITSRNPHNGEGDRVLFVHALWVKVPEHVGVPERSRRTYVAIFPGDGG